MLPTIALVIRQQDIDQRLIYRLESVIESEYDDDAVCYRDMDVEERWIKIMTTG